MRLACAWIALCCGFVSLGSAQTPAPAVDKGSAAVPSASSVIADIKVEYIDVRNVSEEAIFSRILLRPGMAYSQSLVDRSIRVLYETRQFDSITSRTEEVGAGRVRLVFVVQARYRIESLSFDGNKKVKSRRLRRECKTEPGLAVDERQLRKDIDAMLKYYREKGPKCAFRSLKASR